jgi:hypothetical protein
MAETIDQGIIDHIQSQADRRRHDAQLIDIYEGNLLGYVERFINDNVSPKAYKHLKDRISPINVLTRLVDKMSKIYQQGPSRVVLGGTDADSELLKRYEHSMMIDQKMNISNEMFNLTKTSLIQPYLHGGQPKLRPIPNDRFTVYSNDPIDPTNVTHVVLFMGSRQRQDGGEEKVIHVYTDESIVIVNEKGEVLRDLMAEQSMDGSNPIGKIPFVYVNRSCLRLIPVADTDIMRMTLMVPVLLSDLAYSIKFQAFSIIYTINLDDQSIELNPNAIWMFKNDATTEEKGEIGSIKPQVDITEVMNYIQSLMGLWLNTKGIRPGSVGSTNAETFSSGISKMIDEMDTYELREKQVSIYKDAEEELWNLITEYMHPFWVKSNMIPDVTQLFTPGAKVVTSFAPQVPLAKRGDLVADLSAEVAAGFTSRKDAMAKLNPQKTEQEIEAMILEIDAERTLTIESDDDALGA